MHWFDLFDLQFGSIVMCEKITQCCHCVIDWKKYLRSKLMQGEPPFKRKANSLGKETDKQIDPHILFYHTISLPVCP